MCSIAKERIKIIQIMSEVAELSPPHILRNVERLTDLCFDALCIHYGDACSDEILRQRAELFAVWRARPDKGPMSNPAFSRNRAEAAAKQSLPAL
jgi:hypothetical protein